jgi:hypothetical protein
LEKRLLLEDIQRIAFLMNYEAGKVISENEKKPENILMEQKINQLFPTQNLLSENWQRDKDPIGYWKVLFEQLTKGGIGVKWEKPNDPAGSTFMYWGPWVIWKDINKNGGWPVSFTSADKKLWLFKFQGGKYAGQPATNIILDSKLIYSTFNLGQWGKVTGASGGPQLSNLLKTKPKTATSSGASPQDLAMAQKVFNELKYAFDGGGTYEEEAVAAFNKITNKNILDKVNQLVKARGMSGINSVYDWLTDEMSDYDYDQYRAIWNKLKSIDKTIKAPEVNNWMRGAGIVGDVTGINAIEKGAEGVTQLFTGDPAKGFEKIINAVRSFLGGVAGGVITTILDFTGIGKVITSIGWGILLAGDIILGIIKGAFDWINIAIDAICIATTGAVGGAIAKALKPIMGKGSNIRYIIDYIKKSPLVGKFGTMIESGLAKVGQLASKAINWLVSTPWWKKYIASSFIGKAVASVSKYVTKLVDDFSLGLAKAGGAGTNVATKATTEKGKQLAVNKSIQSGQQKVKEKLTTDLAKEVGWAGAEVTAGEVGGETGKGMVKVAKGTTDIAAAKKGLDDATTAFSKGGAGSTNATKDIIKNTGGLLTKGTKTSKEATATAESGLQDVQNLAAV